MKLHEFLFDQLHANGVRQIFGIPGDFVLNLYNALQQDERFRLITLSHEPAWDLPPTVRRASPTVSASVSSPMARAA